MRMTYVIRKRAFLITLCMLLILSLLPALSPAKAEAATDDDYKVVGYFIAWGSYGRDFQVEDMDPTKVTHINYAFADICFDGIHGNPASAACDKGDGTAPEDIPDGSVVLGDPWIDAQSSFGGSFDGGVNGIYGNLGKLAQLKVDNPHLKTLISVGGWSWSNRFSDVAADPQLRQNFANSAVDFVRNFKMDGIDIDWEYPVAGGMDENSYRPEDKQNHTLLLQDIRNALDKAEKEDGKEYLLTIASAASQAYLTNNELDKIAQVVDFINIMTYDFSGVWQSTSGHNAPLFGDNQAANAGVINVGADVATAIRGHLDHGVPAKKLVMGLPFYGKSWAGCEGNPNNGGYLNCQGAGTGTWEAGALEYDDIIANYVNKNGYKRYWNNAAQVPYLFNETTKQFVTYDDAESIAAKVAYIENLGLGGAMIWELSSDRQFTLLSTINNEFKNGTTPKSPIYNIMSDWDQKKVYTAGQQVLFNGNIYTAKWWTLGEKPSSSDAWKKGAIAGTPAPIEAWSKTSTYTRGDSVTYNGKTYKAKWWTLGEKPGTSDVWELIN
ncbi:glycosyl hydrolase family 18 protein [Ferdinandcohnia quinoae]|uniref:chitinase n=1 Tax=Fredinandcohnia quinoae TaxID=2918902 RepID=A0AAW5EFB7_9BACI|nr:glycosyl hydrolase family 18 protein [Fredinandcohnia sp. SECRCQ15]MCH1627489.1 glycosyl hydrolase family 18 protein [Fredinandcohnia sp. SECRCQ15]